MSKRPPKRDGTRSGNGRNGQRGSGPSGNGPSSIGPRGNTPSPPDALLLVALRYLDGMLTADETARFNRLLLNDPRLRRQFAQVCYDAKLIQETMTERMRENDGFERKESVSELLAALAPREDQLHEIRDITEELEQEKAERKRKEAEKKAREAAAYKEQGRRLGLDGEKPEDHDGIIIPYSAFYIGIAALLALALSLGWPALQSLMEQQPDRAAEVQPAIPQRPVVATLNITLDAVWAERTVEVREGEDHEPAPLQRGAPMRQGDSYRLTQGYAQFDTKRGAIITLEAPCQITFIDLTTVALHRGRLVGRCPTARSKGFVVRTPTMRVLDIGTEFGVAVDETGRTDVAVFDGEVEVASSATQADDDNARPTTPQSMRLKEGWAISNHSDTSADEAAKSPVIQVKPIYEQDQFFARSIEEARRRIQLQGDVLLRQVPPPSFKLGDHIHPRAVLILERENLARPNQVKAFLHRSDMMDRFHPKEAQVLPAGGQVDSYYLNYTPGGSERKIAEGSITFPRRIVGVIGNAPVLRQTHERLGHPSVVYPPIYATNMQGLEGRESQSQPETPDLLRIDEDGKTLRFRMVVQDNGVDAIRILVEAEEND